MLSLLAPLPPNVNDKGCAFGGSLVSQMTLSGWALVEMALRRYGHDCDVFVAESHVRYLSPLWQDFRSEARLATGASWATFFNTLTTRGRARIEVACVVPGEDGKPAFAPSVGTLYVRKSGLAEGKIPQTLTVTITTDQSPPKATP